MILLGGECRSLTAILRKVLDRDAVHIIQKSYGIRKILKKYDSYDKIVLLFDSEIGRGVDENTIIKQLRAHLGECTPKDNAYGIKIYAAGKFCVVFVDPRIEEWFIRNRQRTDIWTSNLSYRKFLECNDPDALHDVLKKEKDSDRFAELIVEISRESRSSNAFKFLVDRLKNISRPFITRRGLK